MIFDATRTIANGQRLQADVCIVGAGPAGITLALGLMERGLSVLVLEAGGRDLVPAVQAAYRGRMSGLGGWTPEAMRLRGLGGTSQGWGGWCMPLAEEDFRERAWIPMSGWPIGHDDLEPYYARASRLVEIKDLPWAAGDLVASSPFDLVRGPDKAPGYETRVFRFSSPTNFGATYGPALERSGDVRVFLFASLVKIIAGDARGAVTRLECAAFDGQGAPTPFVVEAGRYVLAMGGIENARMLLASKVANGSDLVGRCFMEHPHYYNTMGMLLPRSGELGFYERHPVSGVDVLGVVGPSASLRAKERILDFTIEVVRGTPTATSLAPAAVGALVARRGATGEECSLTIRAEQAPDLESRVTLYDEVDALGVPRVDLRWVIARDDDVALRRGLAVAARWIALALRSRVFIPTDGDPRWFPLPGGHHMGTTRMAATASRGVVDRNSRCFEVENLYVTGSSVFTTAGASNPTLTIVALAARLADHLAGSV